MKFVKYLEPEYGSELMTYHIFSVRQGHVFWREVLSVLVIRVLSLVPCVV